MGLTSKKALTFPGWRLGDDHQAPHACMCVQNKCFVKEQSSLMCMQGTHLYVYTSSSPGEYIEKSVHIRRLPQTDFYLHMKKKRLLSIVVCLICCLKWFISWIWFHVLHVPNVNIVNIVFNGSPPILQWVLMISILKCFSFSVRHFWHNCFIIVTILEL